MKPLPKSYLKLRPLRSCFQVAVLHVDDESFLITPKLKRLIMRQVFIITLVGGFNPSEKY